MIVAEMVRMWEGIIRPASTGVGQFWQIRVRDSEHELERASLRSRMQADNGTLLGQPSVPQRGVSAASQLLLAESRNSSISFS